MSLFPRLAAALFASALALSPAMAQDFSAPQKQQIETIIRDYLLTNPEILRDAYAALESKQARAEAEQRAGALKTYGNMLTNSPYQAVVGNPKAILFYMTVIPAFFGDLSRLTTVDIASILAVSVAVPLVGNLGLALFLDRARVLLLNPARVQMLNRISGGLLILVACAIPLA
jgi:threonine/homoserine/homoserine lactone efflux protein